jgi:hypothetical protein
MFEYLSKCTKAPLFNAESDTDQFFDDCFTPQMFNQQMRKGEESKDKKLSKRLSDIYQGNNVILFK